MTRIKIVSVILLFSNSPDAPYQYTILPQRDYGKYPIAEKSFKQKKIQVSDFPDMKKFQLWDIG